MSTNTVNTSVFTQMAPPRARLVSAQQKSSPEVSDAVQLGATPASEESAEQQAPKITVAGSVMAGIGLAMAMTGVMAGCSAPVAPVLPAPSAVIELKGPATQAVGEDAQRLMKEIASPSLTDNMTANEVRNHYGDQVDDVLNEAKTFDEVHQQLTGVSEKLLAYGDQFPDGGSLVDNGTQVGIEKADGRLTITAQMPDASVQQVVSSRHGVLVTVRDAQGHTVVMEETARTIKVTDNGVTKTLNRQTGKFEITSQQGPNRSTKVTVDGASIQEEVKETISGFAGMIQITHTTSYEVPQTSIMIYPRVLVTETKTTVSDDGYGTKSTDSTRTEVYDNGSTRTFQRGADGKEHLLEADAPALLIAGR